MQRTINIIGPGRVGRTLGALLARSGLCTVQDILSAEFATAQAAVKFIGAGRAVRKLAELRVADLWLLTPPDAAIAPVAAALAGCGVVRSDDVVFHCSGSQASGILAVRGLPSTRIASVHPLKSFAEPAQAVDTFSGTWCTVEGDEQALALLRPLFEQLGARIAVIDAAAKPVYHAASVLVCNDLTALMEAGLRVYEHAGLERATAQAMMAPLVRETLENVFRLGPARALTGPVARGDHAVVTRQLAALATLDPRIVEVYRALGAIALDLARAQGAAPPAAYAAVADALKNDNKNN